MTVSFLFGGAKKENRQKKISFTPTPHGNEKKEQRKKT